jgi:hypothetical protein
MLRRTALLALLVYVTLDLSLPAMPGAFVFEVDESVESVHGTRGRVAADVSAAPVRSHDAVVVVTAPLPVDPVGISRVAAPDRPSSAARGPRGRRLAARRPPLAVSSSDAGRSPAGPLRPRLSCGGDAMKKGYEGLVVSLWMLITAWVVVAIIKLVL